MLIDPLVQRIPATTLILDALLEQGYVVVERDEMVPRAQLSSQGVKHLLICRWAVSQGPALVPRLGLAPAQRSHWELINDLVAEGWTWRLLPTGRRRQELCYTQDAPKIFYTTTALPHKLYLVCLVVATDIFAMGVERIPHWARCPKKV